jgi:hypothetical protein
MYWRWQSLPELADLPDDERRHLWKQARRDPFRAADAAWLLLVLALCVVLFVVLRLIPRGAFPTWAELLLWCAAFVAFGFVLDALIVARYRPVLRRLRASGADSTPPQQTGDASG